MQRRYGLQPVVSHPQAKARGSLGPDLASAAAEVRIYSGPEGRGRSKSELPEIFCAPPFPVQFYSAHVGRMEGTYLKRPVAVQTSFI
jgi:hypothetical protein